MLRFAPEYIGVIKIQRDLNVGSILFVKRFAPETRGRTLEELEDDFREHDAAHFVHDAPANIHGS